jgi:8-oxo-dGTP pyrophosphatase MutT (NUDIX family)
VQASIAAAVVTVPDPGQPDSMRWLTYGERTIYDNPWVRVSLADVQPPGGAERFEHHVVRLFPVAVSVVLDDEDRVLMLWRHRFVSDQWGWELPGGIVDEGEEGAKTAARETEEETGWRPGAMTHLVTFQPMMGMVDAPHEIYFARGAEYVGEPAASEEAGQVAWIPLDEVPRLLARGQLLGSGTLVGLLYVLSADSNRLKSGGQALDPPAVA